LSGVYFDVQHPAVSDRRVREALRYATDQRTMVDKVALGSGIAQRSLIPATAEGYLPLPSLPYDPKRAAALLDAAGWKMGPDRVRHKNGRPLTLEIAIPSGYAPSANAANILHADWGTVGVAVNIRVWADSEFFAPAGSGGVVQGGKFDGAMFSNGGQPLYASVSSYYTCADFPPNGFNVDRYCNPKLDALNARYAQSFDPAERKRLAAQMQRILDADVPGIVFYQRIYVSAYTNRLRGYHPSTFSSWGDPLQLDL